MPEFFNGLISSGDNDRIKTKNKTSQCCYHRPTEELVLIHMQAIVVDREDKKIKKACGIQKEGTTQTTCCKRLLFKKTTKA